MVVGVVGAYGNDETMLELIKKEFAPLVDDKKTLPEKNVFAWDKQEKPRMKLVSRKVEQAAVSMAFRGLKVTDERRYALGLINIIYGDSWMSRLMREVREERGWSYSVWSFPDYFEDVGYVLVGAGLPRNKLNEAVELMTEISVGLSGKGKWAIAKEDLTMAKECFRGRVALSFDKPEKVLGSALGDISFLGKIFGPEEIIQRIEKVTLEEVHSVAAEIFQKEKMSIAVVGDYKKLDFKI